MTLFVDQSSGVDDSSGTTDLYTISWDDGNLGQGDNSTIDGSLNGITSIPVAAVTYTPSVSTGQATADRLYLLVNTDASGGLNWAFPIIITPLNGGIDPYSGESIAGNGMTYVDTGVTPHVIHVVYDTSQDGGQGIDAFDTAGNPIQTPNAVILYHELSHAYHEAIDQDPYPQTVCPGVTTDEPAAELDENVMRTELGLCLRDPCNHDTSPGWGATCGGSATPGGAPLSEGSGTGGSGVGCFILTAATGSADAREIRQLRELRDRIEAYSTISATLIDAIYREYFQVSPGVAYRIRDDVVARAAVRRLVVRPLFAWYRLAEQLAFRQTDQRAIQVCVRSLFGACPRRLAPAIVPILERVWTGEPLPREAPDRLLEFTTAFARLARMRLAKWALLSPLLGAWTLAAERGDPVRRVAAWLASAPVEAMNPPPMHALETELQRLAGFFDFAPEARRELGSRLLAAWPATSTTLRRHGFI